MISMKRLAIAFVLCAAVASTGVAQQDADPYVIHPDDPFTLSATVTSNAGGSFTIALTVKERATGAVVFAPKVTTQPDVPAEVMSDDPDSQTQFEAVVRIDKDGKADITFKAYRRVLQRSKIEVRPE